MLSGNGTVKIGDFGQSQFFGRRDVFNRTLGTPAYLGACPAAGSWAWLLWSSHGHPSYWSSLVCSSPADALPAP